MAFITPLLKDGKDYVDLDQDEFAEEQLIVAKLVHLIYSNNPNEYFQLLEYFRDKFSKGGKKRQFYTYPSLMFAYMKYAKILRQCKHQNTTETHEQPEKKEAEGEETHNEEGEQTTTTKEEEEGEEHTEEKTEEKKEDEDEVEPANVKIYNVKRKPFKGEIEVTFRTLFDILKEIIGAIQEDQPEKSLKFYLEFIGVINECDPEKEVNLVYIR